jgi:mono/diheme cytochrome c family protein
MNRDHPYEAAVDNQLRVLEHLGLLDLGSGKTPADHPQLVDPYDESQDLTARARSYLHANCAQCHIGAGGGNAQIDLAFATDLDKMKAIDEPPLHDKFGIERARIIAPGDPDRSVLLHRITIRGAGQMPQLATAIPDQAAVDLIRRWIASLAPDPAD